jgi:pimeloyl-ACP methyl ester carboxylesterase
MTTENSIKTTEWGHGPLVVLVHGGTPQGGAVAFREQRPLAERWRLILPDRPGHGATPRLGQEDFERDASLIEPLLEDGAHLVGHSYGAVVALCIAVGRPQAVRSLTLIEPPAYCFAPEDPAVLDMARANRALFEHPPEDPIELVRSFFELVGIDAPAAALPPAALTGLANDLANLRGPHEARIDPVALTAGGYPIQVLTSGRTPAFEAIAAAIAAQTGARHVIVPGTDHTVQDAGEPVNHLLDQFWSTARTGESRTSRR